MNRQIVIYTVMGLISIVSLFIVMPILGYAPVKQLLRDTEHKTLDYRFLHSTKKPSKDIVIVEFDEQSLKRHHEETDREYFDRDEHADIIDFLASAQTKLIVYNVIFYASKKAGVAGQKLEQSFQNHDNVLVPMSLVNDADADGKSYDGSEPITHGLKLNFRDKYAIGKTESELDYTGFIKNNELTYDNYKQLLPGFYSVGDRIAFTNISNLQDGVVRELPLFFRFRYKEAAISMDLPATYDGMTKKWLDQKGHAVTPNGLLIDERGYLMPEWHYDFYPSLALKAFLMLQYPGQTLPKMTLTPQRFIDFAGYHIPLTQQGNFMLDWYPENVDKPLWISEIKRLTLERQALITNKGISTFEKKNRLNEIDTSVKALTESYEGPFVFKPYKTIPVWKLLRAMKNQQSNQWTEEDDAIVKQLNDKVVFVGIRSGSREKILGSPLGSTTGTTIQAMAFDNLYRNQGFIEKLADQWQWLLNIAVVGVLMLISLQIRMIFFEVINLAVIAAVYVMGCLWAFQSYNLWVEVVTPITMLILASMCVYMVKYLRRSRDYRQAWLEANTDSMTGLFNFRFFNTHLTSLIADSQQYDQKFSLLLIDIDHFKKFNDTYGHQAGDEVLRCVARKLKTCVRKTDKVIRYGGEEMAIILEHIRSSDHEQKALEIAADVVRAVAAEAYPISATATKHVTISLGVATFPTHGRTIDELVAFSDKGLYRAKENGRNQVGAQFDEDVQIDQSQCDSHMVAPKTSEVQTQQTESEPLKFGIAGLARNLFRKTTKSKSPHQTLEEVPSAADEQSVLVIEAPQQQLPLQPVSIVLASHDIPVVLDTLQHSQILSDTECVSAQSNNDTELPVSEINPFEAMRVNPFRTNAFGKRE